MHFINKTEDDEADVISLSDKEIEFLKHCCSEQSYKEIAESMQITPRAVEALRSNLFEKLSTTSRVGLVLYAIRNGLVQV